MGGGGGDGDGAEIVKRENGEGCCWRKWCDSNWSSVVIVGILGRAGSLMCLVYSVTQATPRQCTDRLEM